MLLSDLFLLDQENICICQLNCINYSYNDRISFKIYFSFIEFIFKNVKIFSEKHREKLKIKTIKFNDKEKCVLISKFIVILKSLTSISKNESSF